jgi:hypothetical protein
MSEYSPAGVTDAHPPSTPPRESATAVDCGAHSALVVPSFAVKADLIELEVFLTKLCRFNPNDVPMLEDIKGRVTKLKERVDELEQETEYECPFSDEVDLEESECARWDCPVCGNERETDNLPEDRDPDYEHDRRGDDD